jgi:ubiquinone/menaquinone biosynthesis C-methylase UbiE
MTNANELTAQQKAQWSAAAAGWDKCGGWFERNSGGLSEWMCDAAGIKSGSRVLDLACGPGPLATLAAQRVRPGGHVVATDLSPDMVAITARKKRELGLDNLDVFEMDMQATTVPSASFDAVTCRFGLMFCPDPVLGASEARRALRAGGRFAVAVWDVPAKNPFFTAMVGPLAEFVPTPPPDPTAPGVFRLAPPGELERVLRAAGFSDIVVEPRPIVLTYASLDEYWEIQTSLAAPFRAAMATLNSSDVARLKARVFEALAPYMDDGRVRLAAVPLCGVATA